jgi:hypothetical protein
MNRILLLLSMLLIWQIGYGQSRIDSLLNKQIANMFREDQKWRNEYNKLNSGQKSDYDEKTINQNWKQTDSVNLVAAREIVKKYGFPGYALVGKDGSNMFWAIVQHCDDDLPFQKKVSLMMDAQVKRHNASAGENALLKDRILVSSGKKQLYGTQVRYTKETNSSEPFPIEDPENVDKRRKAVGLSPLKEYLLLFKRRN